MEQQIEYVNTDMALVVARVFVFNEKGQILILRRSEWIKIPGEDYRPDLSHMPDLPGGIVGDDDVTESDRVGAMRELLEETGIECQEDQLDLVYATTVFDDHSRTSSVYTYYTLKLDYTPDIKISWEHEAFAWYDPVEVMNSHALKNKKAEALDYLIEHRDILGV